MKTIKKVNLKVLFAALFVLPVILGMTASCNLTMSGKGSLSIKLPGAQETARAIYPTKEAEERLIYKLVLTRQGKTIEEYGMANGTINFELDPGRWNIDITAHLLNITPDGMQHDRIPIEEWVGKDYSVQVGEGKRSVDILAGRHITEEIKIKLTLSNNMDEPRQWAGTTLRAGQPDINQDYVEYKWEYADYNSIDWKDYPFIDINEPEITIDKNSTDRFKYRCIVTYKLFKNDLNKDHEIPTPVVKVYPCNSSGLTDWINDMEDEEDGLITLPPGDFMMNENVEINRNISLKAADDDGTTLIRKNNSQQDFYAGILFTIEGQGNLTLHGGGSELVLDGFSLNSPDSSEGSLVKVGDGCKLVMEDNVTLKDNECPEGGAVLIKKGGTFEMKGGTIIDNEAIETGGGVYMQGDPSANAVFTMTGGTISSNNAKKGSGVYVGEYSSFTMGGSALVDGVVYLYAKQSDIVATQFINVENSLSGSFAAVIEPGKYTDNWQVLKGGGIEANYNKFNIIPSQDDPYISWLIDFYGKIYKDDNSLSVWLDDEDDDTKDGTLRWAIKKLHDLNNKNKIKIIQSLNIYLNRELEISEKCEIEGNGTILRQSEDWYGTELLRIILPSGTSDEVTISQLRFDGCKIEVISTPLGVEASAIKIVNGNLQLKSCIFSNNEEKVVSGYSPTNSVIYQNLGNLSIMGCTFFSNTGRSVIHKETGASNYKVSLIGNIFYGNSNPVLNAGHSTNLDVRYNMHDNIINSSYFTTVNSNKIINELPFSLDDFKIINKESVINNISLTLPALQELQKNYDYPTEDFNGKTIGYNSSRWFPGAVQETINPGKQIIIEINNDDRGDVLQVPPECWFYGKRTIKAEANDGFEFYRWNLFDNKGDNLGFRTDLEFEVNPDAAYTKVAAIFYPLVNDSEDGDNSDTNPGTLRFALHNAEDGDIIKIDVEQHGNKIDLSENLNINKSILIEGNGVTITRIGDNTQGLLTIENNVTLRRLHFDEGLTNDINSGGALTVTRGELTLESCIFSKNRNETTGSGGGAIYVRQQSSLIVKGCTFDNNTSTRGGAIYKNSSGTLELTGNVFYKNGENTVFSEIEPDPVRYNAVDLQFKGGNNSNNIGWVKGTGDKTFTEAGVPEGEDPLNENNFKPHKNLGDFIPQTFLRNLPEKDFNGKQKTPWPGAVNGDQ